MRINKEYIDRLIKVEILHGVEWKRDYIFNVRKGDTIRTINPENGKIFKTIYGSENMTVYSHPFVTEDELIDVSVMPS